MTEPAAGTQYYVYLDADKNQSAAASASASGTTLTVTGDAIAGVTEAAKFYLTAKEGDKDESAATEVTVYPVVLEDTSAPVFPAGKDTYAKRSESENTASFTMESVRPEGTTYQAYTSADKSERADGVTVTGVGSSLTLTGIAGLTESTAYYISATEPEKVESGCTSVTVTPYIAPSVTLPGTDSVVKASFKSGSEETATVTDTINVIFDRGSNPDVEFQASDFKIMTKYVGGEESTYLKVKSINAEQNTVTIEVTLANRFTSGYLDYQGAHLGEIKVDFGYSYQETDASLKTLTLSAGTLTPEFDPGTTSFKATVPYETDGITVTPTANSSAAKIKVNDTAVESGAVSGEISLDIGQNRVTILVTAQDTSVTRTYLVDITREAPAGDAPVFTKNTYTKTSLTNDSASFTLDAQPANGTTYKVYPSANGGFALSDMKVTVSGKTLTLKDISGVVARTDYYISATPPDKSESGRTKVTVQPYNAPAAAPGFASAEVSFANGEARVSFNLTNHSDGRSYRIYRTKTDQNPLTENPELTVTDDVMTLTYTSVPSSQTTYYISAVETGKPESNRTEIVVKPYVAPQTSASPAFAGGGNAYAKTSAEDTSATFTLAATPVSKTEFKVYDAVSDGSAVTVSVSVSNKTLTLTGDAVKNITETATWYVSATEPGKTESSRIAVTISPYLEQSKAPSFTAASYAKQSDNDDTAKFKLTETGALTTDFKVYSQETGGYEATGITASLDESDLTLLNVKGIPALQREITYYISATEQGKGESTRTAVTVKPYEAPSAELADDDTVEVTFKENEADTATKTDTIGVTLNTGSNESYKFQTTNFKVSGSSTSKTPELTGVSITAVGEGTLTVQVEKSVTATGGYVWYRDTCLGRIAITKTVEEADKYDITVSSSTNGSVTASHTQAKAGATVTLNISPESGYELDTLVVHKTGEADTKVEVSGTGNERTFTMPAHTVTVEATFKTSGDVTAVNTAKGAVEGHTFKVAQAAANSAETVKTWLIGEINTLLGEGDTGITVTADSITVKTGADFTAATAGTSANADGTNGSFKFTVELMKNSASATTEEVSGTITATAYEAPEQSAAPVFTASTYTKTSAGDNTAEFTLNNAAASGTNFKVYEAQTGGNALTNVKAEADGITLTLTGISGVASEKSYYISATETGKSESTRTEVTVKPYTATPVNRYAITVDSITNGEVTVTSTEAEEGTTVTLNIAPADGYELNTLKVYKTGEPATKVTVSGTGNKRTFIMPAYAVTVAATFKASVEVTAAPVFTVGTYTKTSQAENTAKFTLKNAAESTTGFKVYVAETGGNALTNVKAEADGSTLTLTGISGVTSEKSYYISATETGKSESTRTKVTVKPYTSTGPTQSSEKEITGFTIAGQVGDTAFDQIHHTVKVTLPANTDVTSLSPEITVSENATVSPANGSAQDFTSPVTYTVTAEDGSTQNYTVTVEVQSQTNLISEVDVTGITAPVAGATPDTSAKDGTHWSAGTVTWDPNHAKFGYSTKYTASVTLTAADGYQFAAQDHLSVMVGGETAEVTRNSDTSITVSYQYEATAEEEKSSAKQITGFTIADQIGNTEINQTDHTIKVTMPAGTAVTNLKPAITVSTGAAVSPASEVAQDFSSPVTYTVTAEDGSTQDYNVTVEAESQINLISEVDVTGITAPVAGGTPDTSAKDGTHWSAGTVTWDPNHTAFGYSTKYTASVTLTAADGYQFAKEGALTATVDGEDAEVTRTSDTVITVSYEFPATDAEGDTYSVTYNLTNLTADEQPEQVEKDGELEAALTAEEGYGLPDTITVKMGGQTLAAGSDYTYDSESGTVRITTVTGNVVITAEGVSDGTFIAVTNITGVPEFTEVGKALKLKGTVKPSNATNQEITWEITDDGGTGASLDDQNHLTAETGGEVTVTATIVNGLGENRNYTEEFSIRVGEVATSSDAAYVASASNAVKDGKYKVDQSTTEDESSFLTELVNLINKILEKLFGIGKTEKIETSDISNLEITVDPVAGDEDDHSGSDGEFTFDVEIHKGDESQTVEGLTGTIKATPFTDEDQAAKDQEAVDNAITEIEDGTYNVQQENAGNEEALKKALKEKAKKKAGKAAVNEIQIVEVEYAAAGTLENPDGEAGTFTFKAKVSKGSVQDIWTEEIEGTIVPEEYVLKKPEITTLSLPDGTVGTEYSAQLTAKSDTEITWGLEGSLPAGLTLSEDGEISGMPEAAGQTSFKVTADNGSEQGTASRNYTITINAKTGETEHTITTVSGDGGTVNPSGAVRVADGADQKFTITPAGGYYISKVLVDGNSVGRPAEYTFRNVTGDHTIEAVFARGSVGPGTDDDDNGGGSHSSGSGSTTTGTTSKTPSTSTNTATAEGGSVTTTTTTSTDNSGKQTTVTTQVTKDTAGNVTGSTTTVTTDNIQISAGEGVSHVTVRPDGSAMNSAAVLAGATAQNPLRVQVEVPHTAAANELAKPEVQSVAVDVMIPNAAADNPNVEIGVTVGKETMQAAKDAGKNVAVTVRNENGTVEAVWSFDGAAMRNTNSEVTDVSLGLHAAPVQSEDPSAQEVKSLAAARGTENGLVLNISGAGWLTAPTKLTVPATNQTGIKAGDQVALYRHDPASGTLVPVPGGIYTVDANGNVTIDLPAKDFAAGPDRYVLLPVPAAGTVPPAIPATAGATAPYEIQRGDTLNKIAREYGCTVEELLELNQVDVMDLRIGQVIQLPAR